MTTVRRIEVGSAFRVGIVLYGLICIVSGLLLLLFQGLFFSSLARLEDFDTEAFRERFSFAEMGFMNACTFFLVFIIVGAISGGIQMALLAFLYNLTASVIGGFRVELERDYNYSVPVDDNERGLNRLGKL